MPAGASSGPNGPPLAPTGRHWPHSRTHFMDHPTCGGHVNESPVSGSERTAKVTLKSTPIFVASGPHIVSTRFFCGRQGHECAHNGGAHHDDITILSYQQHKDWKRTFFLIDRRSWVESPAAHATPMATARRQH